MDSSEKCMLIFILFISMLVIYLASAEAMVIGNILLDPSMDWPEDTYAMAMCKITEEAPYYDCDVTWIMIYLPSTYSVNKYCLQEDAVGLSWAAVGCAFIPYDQDKESVLFIVGSEHGNKSHTGQSVLTHELKHMICKCNFHE